MLKKIFTIALITGAGQLFVVFALKYISQHSSAEQLKAIAQIDSLILFLLNVIALGLQPAAMRNIALAEEWKEEYNTTQSARITLGLIISIFASLAFFNNYYLAFLAASLFAGSGDYALYARGYPVAGAIVAFFRSVFSFSMILLFVWLQPEWIAWIYLGALSFAYIITNLIISRFFKTPYFVLPQIKNLRLYLTSLPLGIVSLSLYFLGLGLVLISSYFYAAPVVAIAYVGLKFYVIFKGILRMIQQAFVQEMVSDKICLKIDQLSSLIGLTFLTFTIFFPKTLISFFFGSSYAQEKSFFLLVALSAFIYSLFSSITTKALLEKKDFKYATIATATSLITIICTFILSLKYNTPIVISVSLLLGECIFVISAYYFISNKIYIKERLLFYVKNLVFIMIPAAFRLLFSDAVLPFLMSTFLFLFMIAMTHFKKFNTLT